MLSKFIVYVGLATVLIAGIVAGQSARGTPTTDGKVNQRPPATPSPTPAATAVTASIGQASAPDDGEVINVTTQLVSVPVRVMDKKGRFIPGLAKEKFKVFENGVEQEVAMFSNERDPFTVALVLDMSYSTKFKIAEIQAAAIAFIDQLRPHDRVTVISFDGETHILCDVTDDRIAIYAAIKSTKIGAGTSIYDAIDLIINDRMRKIAGRKAIILFTDGVDTTSQKSTALNNISDVLELDSLIYPIRYDTFADVQAMLNAPVGQPPPISSPIPNRNESILTKVLGGVGTPSTRGTTVEDYKVAEEYLQQLADRTGGREYLADSLGHLSDAFSKIASELREFYSLGYYPITERVVGKKATVKVRVDEPGVVVRARDGYVMRPKVKKRA